MVKNLPAVRRPGFDPWVGTIPSRREHPPSPVFWPGEFHGLYTSWGLKESDTTESLSLSLPSFSPCSIDWDVLERTQTLVSKSNFGNFLVCQWLGICLPIQGTQISPWSGKIPPAVGQLVLCATTSELKRLEPMLQNKRSHSNEKPYTAARE